MEEPDLGPGEAAVIAAAMREVALADGEAHPQELAMVAAFEMDIPDVPASERVLRTAAAKEALIYSMASVALADGVLSEVELVCIREVASRHGITADQVEATLDAVRKSFFARFAGVRIFVDEALDLARSLGLDEDEARRILEAREL